MLGFVFGIAQMILYMIYKDKKKQVKPMVQPKSEQASTVVDLRALLEMQEKARVDMGTILEMQEKARVDLGVLLGIQAKAGMELGVIVEMQEKPVDGDEADSDKKEDVAKARVDMDGEKTIVPFIA